MYKRRKIIPLCPTIICATRLFAQGEGAFIFDAVSAEDWDYTTRGLASICKEGVDSVCATVRELEAAGYIIRRRIRDKNGQMRGMEYTVLEQPQLRNRVPKKQRLSVPNQNRQSQNGKNLYRQILHN